MAIKIKSTKVYKYLPCGHAQFFDREADGSPGQCSSIHGYDRSVEFTFAGDVDEMGWIVPFGELKDLKVFLEYYFDHVTVLPANDPRLNLLSKELTEPGGLLGTVRILPSGVSMEMSALFIWEHANHYIYKLTNGRCYVEGVRVYEHDRNDAMVEVDCKTAQENAQKKLDRDPVLPLTAQWSWESPVDALTRLHS